MGNWPRLLTFKVYTVFLTQVPRCCTGRCRDGGKSEELETTYVPIHRGWINEHTRFVEDAVFKKNIMLFF